MSYAFEWIVDAAPLPDGRVVVLDNRGARVALFSPAGEWLRDLGRPGSGPGEHAAPAQVGTRGDTILVWDWIGRRLSAFTPAGDVLETRRFAEDKPQGLPLEPFGGGWLDEREWGQGMDPSPARGALVRLHADAVVERIVELPRPVQAVTDAHRDTYFRAQQLRFGLSDEVVQRARAEAEFAATLPTISALLADDRARLWAAEHDVAAGRDGVGRGWDVLDPDGRLIRHVRFPPGFRLLRVQDGRAYGVTVTEDGVHVLDVFDLDG